MEKNIFQLKMKNKKGKKLDMRKKVFNIMLIFAIIFGVLSAGSVYAVSTTNTSNRVNNTNTNTTSLENTTINTSSESIVGEETTSQVETGIPAETQMQTQAQTTSEQATSTENEGLSNHDMGLLAAALATGLACIGAGIAVAVVASSAIGAISENPSLLGKTIIFAGLAEGIAIYGLIISIMILNKI